jgi:hypothetical protein
MKNFLIKAVMVVIVIISSILSTHAQSYMRQYSGSGFFRTDIQSYADHTLIESRARKACFGSMDEASRIFRHDLPYMSWENLNLKFTNEISKQLGSPFNPNNPSAYSLSFIYLIKGTNEYNYFWNCHKDSYVKPGDGVDSRLHWVDPRGTTANGEREECVIAVITEIATGRTALFQATCGNPVSGGETVTPVTEASSNYTDVVVEQERPRSVVYTQPAPVWQQKVAERNTTCHTGKIILFSALGAAVLFAAYELFLKPKSNSYSNQFPYQGGSGPTTTHGGSGGSNTW